MVDKIVFSHMLAVTFVIQNNHLNWVHQQIVAAEFQQLFDGTFSRCIQCSQVLSFKQLIEVRFNFCFFYN